MFKAVIIDDEKKSRDFIELIIKNNFPNIQVTTKASSVVDGIKSIIKDKPEIVFLDIEMHDGNGFDVLDAIPEKNFEFIFITAYNQHAIKAFKYSAVDYLVKPIDIEEFISAVNKVLSKNFSVKDYKVLKENIVSKTVSKLAISSKTELEYINITDIVRFEADGRYTNIYLKSGCKRVVSKALGEFNDLIASNNFFKSHKSHIINLAHVKKFIRKDGGYIIMNDDSQVAITRDKRDEFIKIMSNLSV